MKRMIAITLTAVALAACGKSPTAPVEEPEAPVVEPTGGPEGVEFTYNPDRAAPYVLTWKAVEGDVQRYEVSYQKVEGPYVAVSAGSGGPEPMFNHFPAGVEILRIAVRARFRDGTWTPFSHWVEPAEL